MQFIIKSGCGVVVDSETLEMLGSRRADMILNSKAELMSAEVAETTAERMRDNGLDAEIIWVR